MVLSLVIIYQDYIVFLLKIIVQNIKNLIVCNTLLIYISLVDNAAVLNNSGVALTEANQPFEAITMFQKALVIEPENPLLWLNLGIAKQKTGDYGDAIECFRKSIYIDGNLFEAWNSMGLIYYETNDFEKCEECYLEAISINRSDPKTWNNLGVLYFNMEDFEEARNCFEKSVSLFPQYADALVNLRDTCRELGDYRAAAEFERTLSGLGIRGE